MTVKELIIALQDFNQDELEVRIEDCNMADEITEVVKEEFNYDDGDYFIDETAEPGEKRTVILLRHK